MAETLISSDGQKKWHWYNVASDLDEQGKLPDVVIDPLSVNTYGCGGVTKEGTGFYVSWVLDSLMILSLSQEQMSLVEAFSRVLEYRPFCCYIDVNGLLTFEWDKLDPDGRFCELQNEEVKDLQKI